MGEWLCAKCKGSRLLCGKSRCPILVKFYIGMKHSNLTELTSIDGSSPPAIFVGRVGYPYVQIGPLIPPVHGDTSFLDTPELWIGKSIDDIVSFRFQLVRGMHRVHVADEGRIAEITRELAMSCRPTDVDAEFERKPRGGLFLDNEAQPFGPSAPIKRLNVGDVKVDQRIEKAYYDGDLKARDAILELYRKGVMVSSIQRALSAGSFGMKKYRRFVPTRWSITAVDSTISSELMKKVRDAPVINEFRVYECWNLDNRFIVLMMPCEWSYELIEAWYPKTVWNPAGKRTVIYSSHEWYRGRKTYAEIGGCYYAARLATSEFLAKEGRQARVVILREAHPGYIMPVGVWNVRESVREALRGECRKFDTLRDALSYVSTRLEIRIEEWIRNSRLLQDTIYQRRMEDYGSKVR